MRPLGPGVLIVAGTSKPGSGTARVSSPPAAPELARRVVVASVLLYRLTPEDARAVGDRRARESKLFRHSIGEPVGTTVESGDVLPLIVTFVGESEVRGRVVLDGDGSLWVKTRQEGTERGQWRWPDPELFERDGG